MKKRINAFAIGGIIGMLVAAPAMAADSAHDLGPWVKAIKKETARNSKERHGHEIGLPFGGSDTGSDTETGPYYQYRNALQIHVV